MWPGFLFSQPARPTDRRQSKFVVTRGCAKQPVSINNRKTESLIIVHSEDIWNNWFLGYQYSAPVCDKPVDDKYIIPGHIV